MKCYNCNRELIYDGYGNYHCDKCGATLNDCVLRNKDYGFGIIQQEQSQFWQQGWVCPKCGAVMSPNQLYCLFCQSKNIKDIQVTCTGTMPTISTENKSISKGE